MQAAAPTTLTALPTQGTALGGGSQLKSIGGSAHAGSCAAHADRRANDTDRQLAIEISIEAGILLGGKHKAFFVLGVAGIEPMPS